MAVMRSMQIQAGHEWDGLGRAGTAMAACEQLGGSRNARHRRMRAPRGPALP